MVFKVRDVGASLCAKGLREHNDRDRRYYFFYHGGKKSHIHAKISHSATEIDDYLCSAMSRQINLTRRQFRDLVECPLTAERYLKPMIDTKHVAAD